MRGRFFKQVIFLLVLIILICISCETDKKPDYTVTFNANGASGTPPPSMKAYEDPNSFFTFYTVRLPDKGDLYFEGKIFYGWNTKADGTGEQYYPYTSDYSRMPEITKNIIFYAQWVDEFTAAPTNLNLAFHEPNSWQTAMSELTWDAVPGYENLENIPYYNDGDKFIAYIIFRRASQDSTFATRNFEFLSFTTRTTTRDIRIDASNVEGSIYEYFVALGVITVRTAVGYGNEKYDIVVGAHSNVVTTPKVYENFTGIPAPDNVSAVVVSATKITISWRQRTSIDYETGITGYYIYTSLDGINFEREPVIVPYIHNSITWPIINSYTKTAMPTTTYYFRVAGVTNSGRGNLSPVVSVTTPDLPLQVTGVTAEAHSATCINVYWNENNEATAYRIYYEIGSSTTKIIADTVVGTNYTHTGLIPDTEYRYTIRPIVINTESSQYSNTAYCRTPVSSDILEPIILTITNNSDNPLKSMQINNGNNLLPSDLYKDTSYQIQLESGTYTIKIIDSENRQMSLSAIITDSIKRIINESDWPSYTITLRNNYSFAISKAYIRKTKLPNWGITLLNSPIATNNSILLGSYGQGSYSAMAESVEYYRVNTATNDSGITITGGVLDGYRIIYYAVPTFTLTENRTILVPATGWSKILPE